MIVLFQTRKRFVNLPNTELSKNILLHGLNIIAVITENSRQRHTFNLPELSSGKRNWLLLVAVEKAITTSRAHKLISDDAR